MNSGRQALTAAVILLAASVWLDLHRHHPASHLTDMVVGVGAIAAIWLLYATFKRVRG